jgi:asparagine synthase (glutamine-hydrolysing)
MLRGPHLVDLPFFDQKAVVSLLDRLPSMNIGARVAHDQVLMTVLSFCVLQERFRLSC